MEDGKLCSCCSPDLKISWRSCAACDFTILIYFYRKNLKNNKYQQCDESFETQKHGCQNINKMVPEIDFDNATTREIRNYLEKERKDLKLDELDQSSNTEEDHHNISKISSKLKRDIIKKHSLQASKRNKSTNSKNNSQLRKPDVCVRTQRTDEPEIDMATSLTMRNNNNEYRKKKLAPLPSKNTFDEYGQLTSNFPYSTRDLNYEEPDLGPKSFIFNIRDTKNSQRITNNCLQSYRTERAKTCNSRSNINMCKKKKDIEIIQPARLIEKEKAKFSIAKKDNLLISEMRNQISSMRNEFMTAIKDIKNSVENYSTIHEKSSRFEPSATGQSYQISKPIFENFTLDDECNKPVVEKSSNESFMKKSSVEARSSSVQNNHKTLFYKHAFNKENSDPNQDTVPSVESQEIPCSRCVTIVGNIFLQTFQGIIESLACNSTQAHGVDFSVLEAQADQIKESIHRLKQVSTKVEARKTLSPYSGLSKKKLMGTNPVTLPALEKGERQEIYCHNNIDTKIPHMSLQKMYSKCTDSKNFDNKGNQSLRNIKKKPKKSKKDRKGSKKQKISRNLVEQNQWASRVFKQR
ncbi:unnamed protein product [Moneuplotes crassus]|uniref:Uncharacterized protein n=1 Tax=Euplotes crassus TaxID=5936 RepID=A0AAD1UDD1_EUPCR|nr:unnamed protein product [Moneuplotes crassus]